MNFQTDAPIIQKVYDFYRELYLVAKKMPKNDRYVLGEKTQKVTMELLELLIAASYFPKNEKTSFLNTASVKLDLLKVLLRLSDETQAIPTKKYLSLEEKLQEIGRMLGGWIKSTKASL